MSKSFVPKMGAPGGFFCGPWCDHSSFPLPPGEGQGEGARRIRGFVAMRAFERGRLLWEVKRENLIVNAALAPIAQLVGGTVTNNSIGAVGFGSGTGTPAVTDTDITTPAYYKALAAPTFPQAGQAQFSWLITVAATITKTWAATTAYSVNDTIAPGNGYYYKCTTAGTSGGSQPSWNTTVGGTTTDGTAVWTNQGAYDSGALGITVTELAFYANTGAVALPISRPSGGAPSMTMYAHVSWPAFTVTAGASYQGTWTFVA